MQRIDAARIQITRDGPIRGQHEFLDQAVRDVAFAADDAGHALLVVEFNHRLGQIEIDRAVRARRALSKQRQSRMSRKW